MTMRMRKKEIDAIVRQKSLDTKFCVQIISHVYWHEKLWSINYILLNTKNNN